MIVGDELGTWRRHGRDPGGCRREALLACTLILLGSSGCATAWARDIVRDETGKEVSGAGIAVSALGADAVGARGESESTGCFNVYASAGKNQPVFVLTVTAPGYKLIHVQFQQKERFKALVTLAPKDGPGDGFMRRVEVRDQQKVFEEPCIVVPHACLNATYSLSDGGNIMTDSRLASDDDPATARRSRWAATFRRWFEALNTFLERAFRTADVETGC